MAQVMIDSLKEYNENIQFTPKTQIYIIIPNDFNHPFS